MNFICRRTLALSLPVLTACIPGELERESREKQLACASHIEPILAPPYTASRIEHLVLILQENHSFDAYFGRYCLGGPEPACQHGRKCCERAPSKVGKCDADARALDDESNGLDDPEHNANAWFRHMHWNGQRFLLDRFPCSAVAYASAPDESYLEAEYPAVADPDAEYPLRTYHNLAAHGALADRYFQPIIGASSSNNMFFARAAFVFQDNQAKPKLTSSSGRAYVDTTLGDLLDRAQVSWRVYMEGFTAWCGGDSSEYPFGYDASDNPFNYYETSLDRGVDYARFATDVAAHTLPAFSIVRGLGTRSEHPGDGTRIGDGARFVKEVLDQINASSYAERTLILISWDEGGGFYDHIAPPLTLADGTPLPRTALSAEEAGDRSTIVLTREGRSVRRSRPESRDDPEYFSSGTEMDGQQFYGTRVPLIAVGPFAKRNFISHRVMEHSSIVKFIEWNWLNDQRLGTRDLHVNGIGDLLDPDTVGASVPN